MKKKVEEIEDILIRTKADKLSNEYRYFKNICNITKRFFTALDKDPTKVKEYAPHWIGQMDETMKWFDKNNVNDSELMEIFELVNEVFKGK